MLKFSKLHIREKSMFYITSNFEEQTQIACTRCKRGENSIAVHHTVQEGIMKSKKGILSFLYPANMIELDLELCIAPLSNAQFLIFDVSLRVLGNFYI
jgi:hypothetical protein